MDDPNPTNPKAIAELGEKIYDDNYREEYEKQYLGRYVAIDIETGKAYLGDTPEQALEQAREAAPKGTFHLIKVGAPGAFRVSYSPSAVDWVFQ